MAYIYKITNDINQKIYIGKTTLPSVEERFKQHCNDCSKRTEEHRPLYSAMKKYGIEHFHIEIIEECPIQNLEEKERYWIEKLGSFKEGYNATKGGDGRPYLDHDLIIKTYNETNSLKKTAELLSVDKGWISKIIRTEGGKTHEELMKNVNIIKHHSFYLRLLVSFLNLYIYLFEIHNNQ